MRPTPEVGDRESVEPGVLAAPNEMAYGVNYKGNTLG